LPRNSSFLHHHPAAERNAQQQGLNFQILDEVRNINTNQQDVFFNKVRSALWTLRGKKLASLGLAFKGGTDDIRESPAIDIIRRLMEAGCAISAYDPVAMDKTKAVLPPSGLMRYASSSYEASEGADALLILTDWADFGRLDLQRLKETLRFPIIIDGRNLYKPSYMVGHGFSYISMGRAAAYAGSFGRQSKRGVARLDPPRLIPGLELSTQTQAFRPEA
jgi:UDPglucose 6-dehydrogenase